MKAKGFRTQAQPTMQKRSINHFDMIGTAREFKKALWKHLSYQASEMLHTERPKTDGRKAGDRNEFIPYMEIR